MPKEADNIAKRMNFRIGLIINPLAGIGGPLAHHGSDHLLAPGAPNDLSIKRIAVFLEALKDHLAQIEFYCWGGDMGESVLENFLSVSGCENLAYSVVGTSQNPTNASDTLKACKKLVGQKVDLLVFAGGDGTARDIVDCDIGNQAVLGLPTGVKMQSGVFALNPVAAAAIVIELLKGALVAARDREVRDIDELLLSKGTLNSRYYGELRVPEFDAFLQHTKSGGREVEGLAVQEIVAYLADFVRECPGIYLLGAGSTLFELKQILGIDASLLGVDVVEILPNIANDAGIVLLAKNADTKMLEKIVRDEGSRVVRCLLSFARNQGFLFGRGNQQFSEFVVAALSSDNLKIVSTRSKLLSLSGRPLIVDTGNPDLDASLCGMLPIITGYEDQVFYRVSQTY